MADSIANRVEYDVLGWPDGDPPLNLDHEVFAYAGKFIMTSTGKTVVRDAGEIVGAVAFSPDHDDSGCLRLRYVTVREDRRGEGIGPRLLRFTAATLQARCERVDIAVNNPIAYQAAVRAGFVWTGQETGLAELRMRYDPDSRSVEQYQAGWSVFRDRTLPDEQRAVLERHCDATPPTLVEVPG